MKEIWLIRHGETEWSLSGQHTGRTDIPLTTKGLEQASRLAPRLAGELFERVLTSPLQRARQTATLAGFPNAQPFDGLLEWHYGDLEGRTSADIREDLPGWSIWKGPIPGGETIDEVATRGRAVIAACDGARSAVFAHGHFLRVLATCWLDIPPTEGRLLALSTASVSVLGYEHETRVIKSWNLTESV